MIPYLLALVLIAAAYPLARAGLKLLERGASARAVAAFCLLLLALAVALPWAAKLSPFRPNFDPPAKIWAAASMRELSKASATPRAMLSVGGARAAHAPLPSSRWLAPLAALAAALALLRARRLMRDALDLRTLLRGAYTLRRLGRARVVASEAARAPFSALTPRGAWIVLPLGWMAREPRELRLAVAHELEHHRQRHTAAAWALEVFRCAFAIHPLAPAWTRLIARAQEFSCDEALIGRRRFSAREYGRCLYEAAQSASLASHALAGTAGMASGGGGHFLKGRILMLKRYEDTKSSTGKATASYGTLTLIALAFAGTAWVAQASVGDSRVTMEKARAWAEQARASQGPHGATAFPIVVNEAVLEQLNRYIGTPDGRDFVRASLERMKQYQPLLDKKLSAHEVPSELLAVGIVESGYRNLPARANRLGGAGVWQFIKETARVYGLKVNDQVDERNDVPLETDAAFRYLKKAHGQFNDWLLGILAYNAGEASVEKAIRKQGTRDAWALADAGVETDEDYLAKVMAMVLILKNPSSLSI